MEDFEINVYEMLNEQTDLTKVEELVTLVGTENNVVTNLPVLLKSNIMHAYSSLVTFNVTIDNLLSSENDVIYKDLKKDTAKLEVVQDSLDFMSKDKISIPVMPGLNTTVLFAAQALASVSGHSMKGYKSVLMELDTLVSKFISSPDFRKSLSYSDGPVLELLEGSEVIVNAVNSFMGEENVDRKPLNRVTGNFKELIEAGTLLIDINSKVRERDLKEMEGLTESIASRVKILAEILEDDDTQFTSEKLKSLAVGISAAANIVSNLAAYHHALRQIALTTSSAIKAVI